MTVKTLLLVLLYTGMIFSQNIDIGMLREINLERDTRLDNSFQFLSSTATVLAVGIPVIMLGTGYVKKDSRTRINALYTGVSLITAATISTGLKYGIDRPRPFAAYPDIQKCAAAGSPSFPSGHTSMAFAFATSVSIAYPKWYIVAPAYLWATAVGYSRMDLGVHYPSDVLVGALVGAGSAWLCHAITRRFFRQKQLLSGSG